MQGELNDQIILCEFPSRFSFDSVYGARVRC
jgi:hypothetical protein